MPSFTLNMITNVLNKNYLPKAYFSTQPSQLLLPSNEKTEKLENTNKKSEIPSKIKEAYLSLIIEIIAHFKLKDNKFTPIEITFNSNDLLDVRIDSLPLDVKKFCSNIRVASHSYYGRNLIEIFLLPLSRYIAVDENALTLSENQNEVHQLYKELMLNDKIREACIRYIDQIPQLSAGVITTRTTLKSFKRHKIVQDLSHQIQQDELTMEGRHLFVGLFLESILFEMVNKTGDKHSKARILNFMIDLVSKSRV